MAPVTADAQARQIFRDLIDLPATITVDSRTITPQQAEVPEGHVEVEPLLLGGGLGALLGEYLPEEAGPTDNGYRVVPVSRIAPKSSLQRAGSPETLARSKPACSK